MARQGRAFNSSGHEGQSAKLDASTVACERGGSATRGAPSVGREDEAEVEEKAEEKAEADSERLPVRLLYANVTKFGTKLRDFVEAEEETGSYAGMAFVETRASRGAPVARMRRQLRKGGFASKIAEARETPGGGYSGGAVLGVRTSQSLVFAHPLLREANIDMQGDDWVAVIARVKGLTVCFVFAYFLSGAEHSSENISRFKQILKLKRVLGLPMVLTADFNQTPSQITECQWRQMFGGFIQAPECDFTCSAGTGRILDFCLVSFELRGLLKVSTIRGPWKPHLGLILEILRNPCQVRVLKVWAPSPLPCLRELRKTGRMHNPEPGKTEEKIPFTEPEIQWIPSEAGPAILTNAAVASSLANWSKKLEINILNRARIPKQSQKQSLGRCKPAV